MILLLHGRGRIPGDGNSKMLLPGDEQKRRGNAQELWGRKSSEVRVEAALLERWKELPGVRSPSTNRELPSITRI